MTTIAFDGRYLAADTRGVWGHSDIDPLPGRKLEVSKTELVAYASTGRISKAHRAALIHWWERRGRPDDMPPHGAGEAADVGNFLVIEVNPTATRALTLSYVCPYPTERGWPFAMGSGGDFAIGAMEHGGSAMEAVAIAARRDTGTGGAIEFIDTHNLAAGVQVWDEKCDQARREDEKRPFGGLSGMRPDRVVLDDPDDPLWPMPKATRIGKVEWSSAPVHLHMVIDKPSKVEVVSNDGWGWLPECTGRLVLGTGCGHCLRCNREWHSLKRQAHELVDGNPDKIMITTTHAAQLAEKWADKQVRAIDEQAIGEAVADTAALGLGITRITYEEMVKTDREAIEDWVEAYNAAQAVGDMRKVRSLDDQLRGLRFPDGCELVADAPDNEFPHWRRRLVWVTCQHDAKHTQQGGGNGTAQA